MVVAQVETNPLLQVRAHVLGDRALQQRLAEIEDRDAFCAAVAEIAAALGFTLDPVALAAAVQPDVLNLDRFAPQSATDHGWPGDDWLPVDIVTGDGDWLVVWAHFAGATLHEPFFEQSQNRARRRPFNRLFRYRTPLGALLEAMPEGTREPDGLIYHLSRCGSTLVAQMISALPDAQVVSESPTVDAIVQLIHTRPDVPEAVRVDLLRAIVAAYGRRGGGPFVLKLDSWHTLALPVFRAAFPRVPWVFLFRDPVEILVSQARMRGLQTVPGAFPGDLYGIENGHLLPMETYCARVLAKVCDGVLASDGQGGLIIEYPSLPCAVAQKILPHFGIAPDAGAAAGVRAASLRDAKNPHMTFTDDRAAKQATAGEAIRAAVNAHLGERYAALRARSA